MSNNIAASWEREKFAAETELKDRELRLSERRLTAETHRNVLIGVLVPITLAIVTALPAYLNSQNQQALQRANFEAQLITESVRTGDPDQAAANLSFLADIGLLSDATASRLREYLVKRSPGSGRALPAQN